MHAQLPTKMRWIWRLLSTNGCSFRYGRRLAPWTAPPKPPALGKMRRGPYGSIGRASPPWRPRNARPPRPSRWPNATMPHTYPGHVHTPGNRRPFPLPSSPRLRPTPASRCESSVLYRIMYGNKAMEVQERNNFVVGSDNTELLES